MPIDVLKQTADSSNMFDCANEDQHVTIGILCF